MERSLFIDLLTSRLRFVAPGMFMHWCPACMRAHRLQVGMDATDGHQLGFDGDVKAPTFEPEVEHREGTRVCRYLLRGGRLIYSPQSTHDLAGKDLELPYFPLP